MVLAVTWTTLRNRSSRIARVAPEIVIGRQPHYHGIEIGFERNS